MLLKMKVKIARIKREYLKESFRAADIIFFKHQGKYYRWTSYAKNEHRISQKGKKFSISRWVARNSISFYRYRSNQELLDDIMYRVWIEEIDKKDLDILFSHYRKYIEGCGVHLDIHLVEDFDVIKC